MMKKRILLINADEASVSRHTQLFRSWSLKGVDSEMKAGSFKNSISLITAISSSGWHFSHISNNSTNSVRFIDFLKDLKKFVRNKEVLGDRVVILLLDNAKYHKSKLTMKELESSFDFVLFLSSHSPQYAPVEHFFSCFKRHLSRE